MRVHFVSLGCDKNLVDSEIMLGIMHEEGYAVTADEKEADVIIINTCGFIADASEEGVNMILQMAEHKKTGSCKAIVVTGCMAQRYKDDIFNEIPEVDAIVGVGDFHAIGQVIREAAAGKRVRLVTDENKPLNEQYSLKRMAGAPAHFAYLKIAEGCDNRCTYCTIPSIRGRYRSRSMESLLEEAAMLAKRGVKELILVAQDTALYGTDLYGENRLHLLLNQLAEITGIEWIRLLSAYPEHITGDTISEMSQNPKVCHYLDMPIQHADDNVLKRMGRRSQYKGLVEVISRLRKNMPDISLRTTLIVGFPGETDEEFQTLLDFVAEIKFDRLGVFEYSKEEGTAAFSMSGQITQKVKKQRKDRIMRLQKEISNEKCKKQVGNTLKVIVDGKIPGENVYCGRSYMDCYDIDGMVFFEHSDGGGDIASSEIVSGEFVNVTVTRHADYDLIGVMENEFAK